MLPQRSLLSAGAKGLFPISKLVAKLDITFSYPKGLLICLDTSLDKGPSC